MTEQTPAATEPQTEEQRVAAEAAAAEKYRNQAAPPVGTESGEPPVDEKPARPEHVPEKFWDAEKGEVRVEELAKSYAELEKQRSKAAEAANATPEAKAAAEAAATAQAEFAALREATTQAIVEHGAPTDEQYAAYEARGFARSDVDAFIEGQKAIGTLRAQELMGEVGGETNYSALLEWGQGTYSAEEIAAYNRDVGSEDAAVRLNAVRGLAARYELANGKLGKSVTTSGATTAAGAGYTDRSQMIADMRDPKYAKDESFRQEVARKVQLARAAGVDLR